MALKIKPTPILSGSEADRFNKRVKENLTKEPKKARRPNFKKAKNIAFGNESTHKP